MPPACKCLAERTRERERERERDRNRERQRERERERERAKTKTQWGLWRFLCVPRSVWDCCLIAMFTQQLHPMSLAHSVVSFVLSHHSTAPWGHYCSTGLSGENWHILCGKSWYTPWSCFLLRFQTAMGPINFWPVHIPGTAVAFNGLVSSGSHVTVYLMRQITVVFYNGVRVDETKQYIHIHIIIKLVIYECLNVHILYINLSHPHIQWN